MITLSSAAVLADPTPILAVLAAGGVVVAPTDTSYGLLVDATQDKAVRQLFTIKERPLGKAISVFVDGFAMMQQYVVTQKLKPEVKGLLPGSYTIVLPSTHAASALLEAEDGSLGVRYIANPLIQKLVTSYGKPLTATSANTSGKSAAYSIPSFLHQLTSSRVSKVAAVIDGGVLPLHSPSTVISLMHDDPTILRSAILQLAHQKEVVARSEAETADLATELFQVVRAHSATKPVVILLEGELGSGKTTWTKYFAARAGIRHITSPTYMYECEYPMSFDGQTKLLRHFDLYNLTNSEDIAHMNLNRMTESGTINVVEWPAQMGTQILQAIASAAFVIRLEFTYHDETTRHIKVEYES